MSGTNLFSIRSYSVPADADDVADGLVDGIPTLAGKTAADEVGAAAGASTAEKLIGLVESSTKRMVLTATQAAADATTASAPWAAPTIYFPDQARSKLERASGGRATIFYSADGLKTPCEVVWLDAYAMADVAPDLSRNRANSTAYVLGALLMANSQLYEVTTAGTTHSSAPTYGVNPGDTVADGTAVLTLRVNAYNDIHPAFLVAGTAKAGLWIGRFNPSVVSSKPLCVPGQLPGTATINQMRTYCTNFGNGMRPMTHWDWSAVWFDAVRKGIVPVGNTNYGRSHKTTESVWGGVRSDAGRPGDTSGANPYTLGGSAGRIWTHNREEWGVHDFVGNIWQWCDGAKLMDGQLYIAAYDNDATLLSTEGEASWVATGVYFDSPAAGNDAGTDNLGTPRLDAAVTNYTASVTPPRDTAAIQADNRDLDWFGATWSTYGTQAGYDAVAFASRLAAQRMGLAPRIRSGGPSPLSASEGYGFVRNNGERFALRGGTYYNGSAAGPAYCLFYLRRGSTYGFRPVFVP